MDACVPSYPRNVWHPDQHRQTHQYNNHFSLVGSPILAGCLGHLCVPSLFATTILPWLNILEETV
jgi:hypothetical protein